MANPIDPSISSKKNKYVNISGLQAFYDELPTKLTVDSAKSAGSASVANNAQNLGGTAANDIINSAKSGAAASAWVTANQTDITNLKGIKTFKTIAGINATTSADSLSIVNGGNISVTTANKTITLSAKDTTYTSLNEINTNEYKALTGVSGVTSYFTNGSAKSADKATSATSASILTNKNIKVSSADYAVSAGSATKLTSSRTIAASGDGTWSVSFNGANNVTGNLQITNVPWSAISSHTAAVDASTTNKFTTPKAVNDAITAALNTKASFLGPETSLSNFTTPYDKTAIYLVGPISTVTGADKYNEYVVTGTAGTTADFLMIGDTSTDLSDYHKTTAFNTWTAARFDGNSAKWAKSATSATNAANLTNTAIKVASATSADYATNAGTASYATSAGAAPVASHTISSHSDSANFFSGNSAKSACSATSAKNAGTAQSAGTAASVNASQWNADSARYILFGENKTATTVGYDSDFTYNPSSNKLLVKNISSTNITATTFSGNLSGSARSALTSQYAVSAGAAPLVSHDHGYKISANTTAFNVSGNIQLSAGTNIGLVSAGTNVIGITAKDTTPNNKTITITSGASPATGSFTLNQNTDKTITLGTMAFKASGDFSQTGHNHNYKLSGNGSALDISAGINLKPNGNIAITTAANTINISAKDTTYTTLNSINTAQYQALTSVSGVKDIKNYATISAASGTTSKGSFAPNNSADTFTLIAGNNIDFVSGANSLTISSKTYTIPTVNDKTIKITTGASPATGQFSTNTAADKTITLGSMALAQTSSYSTTGHNHSYQLSGNGTAVNVSAGINFKPSGSNIQYFISGNDIYISAKNNTYTTANFITANKTVGVSSNGTNVGTVNLSGIAFSGGTNIGLSTAANNVITITAKDTTYTSLNGINSTEYNALTSTSANSRNPNAHQLSSHTNFSTYFDGTSANSALTSKSALSAGSAAKAAALSNTAYKVASATSASYADRWTTQRTIAASGDVTWSVTTNGSANITGNASINSVPWSAISSHTAIVDSATTNKFTTPKAVNDAITAAMSTKASFKGPYTARSAIPTSALDKLSIYLIGPTGIAPDQYEEWILTGTTTAQMLQIGDTTTDLSDYAKKNGSYTTLSAGYATATNTAQTMKSAMSAATASYAVSAGAAPVASHQFSSHTNFSTYFSGTSANSALTSKSALSAGSAAKAASATSALTAGSADKVRLISLDNASNYQVILGATGTQNLYYDSDLKIQYNTSSNTFYSPNISATNISGNSISAGKLTGTQFVLVSASATQANITAGNATDVNNLNNPKIGFWNSAANQKGYLIWTDVNASNLWSAAETAFYGTITDGFVVTSDQLNSILVSKNLSATNFKATKISATNISGNLTGWATSANNAQKLLQTSIGFSRTTAQGGDGKKWCRIASKEITNFTTASVWGSCEAELNIYTKSYGDDHLVDRGKVILYCQWGHASASTPTYSMKTNGSRGARWLYWKPQQTSTSVSADSSVSAYAPFNGLKKVDIKIVATDTSVEWWLYNDVWDTTILYTNYFSDNLTLYGKNSAKTLGEFKTYLEDNRTQWDDVQGDGSYINYALSAKAAPVASHTISSHSDSANFFSSNSARSACSATSAKNAGTATYATSAGAAPVASHNHNYTISAKTTAFNVSAGIQLSAGSNIDITSAGTKSIGISARNDIANASDKSTYFDGTSALYAKSATSATNAAKAADSDKLGGVLPGGYSLSGHNHAYKLSGNGTAVNVSAGVNFKPSGSNIKFYVSGNDIYISAKNDNSTAYIPSGFQISGINGTTTGVYYLSALKLNAGTNIGFTSASNSQITITAKDTTYTTANFITANKTVGVSSNGTNVGTVNLSAISFSAGTNVALGTAANNIITITAKDTTYTSLNGINSTEYNALTSTSANSRNPNAHQLSSHTNFSTYFNGTSANSALTSKSALSAGSATTAENASTATNATKGIWAAVTDNRNYPVAISLDSKFNYTTTGGANHIYFNPASGQLNVVSAVKIGGCQMKWNASTSALDFNF